MVDVIYKNNVLVKTDETAVNLEIDKSYKRIEGLSRFVPYKKIGCEWIYNVTVRYIIVGVSDFQTTMNDIFNTDHSIIISTDTNRERILREEKLQNLLPTNLNTIYKIVYEVELKMSKDECARLCVC